MALQQQPVAQVAGAVVPVQQQMFPVRAHAFIAAPPGKSAHALGEVEAEDGFRYVVKGDANGELVRASEWICGHLASSVGIVTPSCVVIQMLGGELVFGSRIVSGLADNADLQALLLGGAPVAAAAAAQIGIPAVVTPGAPNMPQGQAAGVAAAAAPAVAAGPTLPSRLSSLYAFDLAIGNEDRHIGNYLGVEVAGIKRIYAYDFSWALFFIWPFAGFPLTWSKVLVGRPSNTLHYGRMIRAAHAFDLPSALEIVKRLEAIDVVTVTPWLNQMPQDWLPDATRADFLAWWVDGRRIQRLNDLRTGLSDASLL